MDPKTYRDHYVPGDTILVYFSAEQADPEIGFVTKVHDNGIDAFIPGAGGRRKGLWHLEDDRVIDDREATLYAFSRGMFLPTEQTQQRWTIAKRFNEIDKRLKGLNSALNLLDTPAEELSKPRRERKQRILQSVAALNLEKVGAEEFRKAVERAKDTSIVAMPEPAVAEVDDAEIDDDEGIEG